MIKEKTMVDAEEFDKICKQYNDDRLGRAFLRWLLFIIFADAQELLDNAPELARLRGFIQLYDQSRDFSRLTALCGGDLGIAHHLLPKIEEMKRDGGFWCYCKGSNNCTNHDADVCW